MQMHPIILQLIRAGKPKGECSMLLLMLEMHKPEKKNANPTHSTFQE